MNAFRPEPRQSWDLSPGWSFVRRRASVAWLRGDAGPEGEPVDLPHCWNAQDAFQPGLKYYRGPGSYRHEFVPPAAPDPAADHVWRLETEGFYGTGQFRLNGVMLAAVDGQYLGVNLDLTGSLRPGDRNVLGVTLTNRCPAHVLPGTAEPDFLLYGGLSGRVFLRRLPALRILTGQSRVLCRGLLTSGPAVELSACLVNESSRPRRAAVRCEIVDADGAVAACMESAAIELPSGGRSGVRLRAGFAAVPRLWEPASPHLYRADCFLVEDGRTVDAVAVRFGARDAAFRRHEGFFLNGRRLFLEGFNRHESIPGFGRALPRGLQRADARLIKGLGANFVRLSHYPQHPDFLDACDEFGLLVYAEIATWKRLRAGRWLDAACRQLRDMIERDRNRPSVILWGLANEGRSRKVFLRLRQVVRELDPGRPTIYAENHMRRARRRRTPGITDVWGCNYELEELESGRDAAVLGTVIVSECCNRPGTRRGDLEAELEQARCLADLRRQLIGKPFVAGYCAWCLADYATLRKKRFRRFSGVTDAWRLPKPACALVQAALWPRPFLRVYGNWSAMDADRSRWVHIFTNCDRVRISLNGKAVESLPGEIWISRRLEFEPGELTVTGVRGGEEVSDRIVSWGPAAGLRLEFEPATAAAESGECVGLLIWVVDAEGRRVRDWRGEAAVAVSGAARLRAYTATGIVPIAAGLGRTYVSSTGMPGPARATAAADGLEGTAGEVRFVSGGGMESGP